MAVGLLLSSSGSRYLGVLLRMQHSVPQKGIQEALDLSCHNDMEIPYLKPSASVFDPLIRMEKVVPDLGSKTCYRLALIFCQLFCFPFLFLDPSQSSSQHLPCMISVLVLAPLVLTLNHDPRRHVC